MSISATRLRLQDLHQSTQSTVSADGYDSGLGRVATKVATCGQTEHPIAEAEP